MLHAGNIRRWRHRKDDNLRNRLGSVPPSGPPREQATAEKCAFEGAVAVDAATAKAGDLTRRVEPGNGLTVDTQCATLQIRLQPSERLSRQNI